MSAVPAVEGFVEKWRAREPEMALVEVFCPAPDRSLLRAIGALQSELVESIFEISDSMVARTKLTWWMQDLHSGERGRHPLTRAIHAAAGDRQLSPDLWLDLLRAALDLLESDHRPTRVEEAIDELLPFSGAWAAVESGLSGNSSKPSQMAFCLQTQRSLRALAGVFPERSRLPAPWTASPDAERIRHYAATLLEAAPGSESPSLTGVIRVLSARARLRRLAVSADATQAFSLSPWTSLGLGWRAARVVQRERRRAQS